MSKALNADDELDKYLFVTWNMKDTVINRAMADGIKKWRKKHELQAQLNYIEYLDQTPSNELMDWKGLLADSLKLIKQEIEEL